MAERDGTERRRRDQHPETGRQLWLADRESRPDLHRTVAVAGVLEGRVRITGCLLDAVDLAFRHDVLHGQQAAEVEGRYLRRRTAHRRDSRHRPARADSREREARGTASRVAARAARDAHPRRPYGARRTALRDRRSRSERRHPAHRALADAAEADDVSDPTTSLSPRAAESFVK